MPTFPAATRPVKLTSRAIPGGVLIQATGIEVPGSRRTAAKTEAGRSYRGLPVFPKGLPGPPRTVNRIAGLAYFLLAS